MTLQAEAIPECAISDEDLTALAHSLRAAPERFPIILPGLRCAPSELLAVVEDARKWRATQSHETPDDLVAALVRQRDLLNAILGWPGERPEHRPLTALATLVDDMDKRGLVEGADDPDEWDGRLRDVQQMVATLQRITAEVRHDLPATA